MSKFETPTCKPGTVKSWSFSRWELFETCPLQFFGKHLAKPKWPTEGSPAMQRGNDIHIEGEHYLKDPDALTAVPASYVNFADLMEEARELGAVAEQELALSARWKACGYRDWNVAWVRGKLDMGLFYEDNTADVVDFKTGRKYGENEEQVELFGTIVLSHMPRIEKVRAHLWYLDDSNPKTNGSDMSEDGPGVTFTRDQLPELQAKWNERVGPMFAATRFPPRPSSKCRFCDFRSSKGGQCKFDG